MSADASACECRYWAGRLPGYGRPRHATQTEHHERCPHAPIDLQERIRSDAGQIGLEYVSLDRIGTHGAKVTYIARGVYKVATAASQVLGEQTAIDIDLYAQLAAKMASDANVTDAELDRNARQHGGRWIGGRFVRTSTEVLGLMSPGIMAGYRGVRVTELLDAAPLELVEGSD